MPLAVDNLTPESSIVVIREAIGASIEQCMDEPNDTSQEQCAAIAYSIAREKTGKELEEGTQR